MYLNVTKLQTNQQGSALIVVMVVVLLLSIVGAMIVKRSITDVTIATNDELARMQANTAEEVINALRVEALQSGGASTGFVANADEQVNANAEVVFCYLPKVRSEKSPIYDPVNAGTIRITPPVQRSSKVEAALSQGYCNPSQLRDRNSMRDIAFTQINVKSLTNAIANEVVAGVAYYSRDSVLGMDKSNGLLEGKGDPATSSTIKPPNKYRVILTTVFMSLGGQGKEGEVQACLTNYVADTMDLAEVSKTMTPVSVGDCLARLGVPATTYVGEFSLFPPENSGS